MASSTNDNRKEKTLADFDVSRLDVFAVPLDAGEEYDEAINIAPYLNAASEENLDAMMSGNYDWLLTAINTPTPEFYYHPVEDLDDIPWEYVYGYIFLLRESRNV